MTKIQTTLTDRSMQLELAKLKDMGLIKPEGKTRAIIWFLTPSVMRNLHEIYAK
jgi:hypothetical protein